MARDVDMRCTNLLSRRQVGQGQRHLGIVRHQFQHPGIELAHGLAQQPPQMGAAPVGMGHAHGSSCKQWLVKQADYATSPAVILTGQTAAVWSYMQAGPPHLT